MLERRRLGLAGAGLLAGGISAVPARAQSQTLLDIIQRSSGTSRFAELVKAAGAEAEFNRPGRRSAFVPENAAMEQIPAARMRDLQADKARLRALVLNHLVEGAMMIDLTVADSGNMGTDQYRSLGRQSVAVSFGSGGAPRANGAAVTLANVPASNGVLHVISGVIED